MNDGHMEFCTSEAWREILEDVILPDALARVNLGPRVIEVGPGPGFTTNVLLRTSGHVTAVELDPVLAGQLRARLGDADVDIVVGDAKATGLPAAAFTGAASFNMFHHIPTDADQDDVFAELSRVLAPGGQLLLTDGFDSEDVRRFHQGDTYHPVDPATLPDRLGTSGFVDVDVASHELGWICTAARPG
jgi:SAM-dependent methyltransferase